MFKPLPKTQDNLSNKTTGFTLIELLVVITVIGALSGILLSVINSSGVRAKARDSQRKSDLAKIQTALELYFADNRAYPVSNGNGTDGSWEQIDGSSQIETALESGDYIDPVPEDPSEESAGNQGPCGSPDFNRYNYRSDSTFYFLTAIMEVSTSNEDSPCPSPNWSGHCSDGYATADYCYYVQNP